MFSGLAYKAYAKQAELQSRALTEARLQNDAVGQIEGEARQLLAAAATAAAHPETCPTAFQDLAKGAPFFAGLTAFDLHGLAVCTGPATWLKRVDPKLIESALAGEGFAVGEHTVADTIAKKVLPFAQVVYDDQHHPTGVVVTMVELDRMARRLARNWRFEDSVITVADRSANILVRLPNSASWVGRRLPDELVSVLRQPQPGTTKVALGSGDRIEAIGYVPLAIAPKDLFVSVHFQTTTVLGEVKRSLRKSVMPVTLVLLAAGLLLVLLPQRTADKL
ncbi:MAG: cache domain-containing protein [Alphaproteobacteria bacterium]|nr:cache domain-containing protein [Alphaproteobacteria bacterium]